MSGVIRWEDPPSTKRPGRKSTFDSYAVAEDLRSRPGVWGVVTENPANAGMCWHITTALHLHAFRPAGSFEARLRTLEDGTLTVYARYVGRDEVAL